MDSGCPDLPDPVNGLVIITNMQPGVGFAIYICTGEFIINGDAVRNCQDDGTWSGDAPTCESMSQL